MDAKAQIALVGTQSSTANALALLSAGLPGIDLLITLPPERSASVADYVDLRDVAEAHGVPWVHVGTYGMKDHLSQKRIGSLSIDAMLVVGWQRLIPKWLLDKCRFGVYGMHGSALPLPFGRGRSPMNWSIIEGRDRFITCLFRYEVEADAGGVVGCQRFDIESWDDIRSLHHKNTLAQCQLWLRHVREIVSQRVILKPQRDDFDSTWYPKRVPDDGVLDFYRTARELHRLIRAVSAPYPGAFTFHGERRIEVLAARPFDSHLDFGEPTPGTIVATFSDGTFVVQCIQDTLYVTGYRAADGESWVPRRGTSLRGETNRSWVKLREMYS